MASTYSNLKIQLMATGENTTTWGTVTNVNLGTALEEAIVGSADVAFSSANVTLTLTDTNATQTARNMRLNLTGTATAGYNLVVPAIEKPYLVNNATDGTITVKNATGTGIAVPAGKTMWVYNNGTNVVDATNYLTSLALGTALPVSSGGTGANTAPEALTALGATTVGGNVFTLTDPDAITFPRFNADNTVSALDAASFRTAIGAGAGTVTSVGFTGGIISVATATSTPAFTIAGTSGGIPYFASGTTWATSAALAANSLVIGGGAGAAPATVTTGTGVVTALGVAVGSAGAFVVNGGALGTPSSGTLSNCTVDGTNSVGYRNVPQSGSDKTTSYTLATTDVGKFIGVGTGGSITIPDATFAAGDIISLFNNTTGNITITCTITTAYIGGVNTDKATMTLATRGVATVLFISGTVCVVVGNVS